RWTLACMRASRTLDALPRPWYNRRGTCPRARRLLQSAGSRQHLPQANQRVRSAMKSMKEQIGAQPAAGRLAIEFDDVAAAAERLDGHSIRTPVLSSTTLDARCGARVFFKCESLPHGGAFKFRGAFNTLSQLSADQRRRGVVAFSSGNHAIAVSLAAKRLGI